MVVKNALLIGNKCSRDNAKYETSTNTVNVRDLATKHLLYWNNAKQHVDSSDFGCLS